MNSTTPTIRLIPFPVLGDDFPRKTPNIERIKTEIGCEIRH
jgi:hypothetical protein